MFGLFGPPKVQCSLCGKKVPKYRDPARKMLGKMLSGDVSIIAKTAYQCKSCRAVVCFACSGKVTELPPPDAVWTEAIGLISARVGEAMARVTVGAAQLGTIFIRGRATCPKCGKKEVGFCD